MPAQGERVAVLDGEEIFDKIPAVEVVYHSEGLVVADYDRLGIGLGKRSDARGMVGLNVLDYEIIGLSAVESGFEITEPFVGETAVRSIENGNFFIENNI